MKTDYQTIEISTAEGIALFFVKPPPFNRVSKRLIEDLTGAFQWAYGETGIRAIVLGGTGQDFIGGTDIHDLRNIRNRSDCMDDVLEGQRFVRTIEMGPKPVIAAINGDCSRSGLEVALACHYRIAVRDSRMGLLDVRFGLIPGMGGTQRLPRLVGLRRALEMITEGLDIPVEQAKNIGLIDELATPENLLEKATSAARQFVAGRVNFRMCVTRRRTEKLPSAAERRKIITDFRERLEKTAEGYTAPWKALEAVERGLSGNFQADLDLEAELFCDCVVSDVSRYLIDIFTWTRQGGHFPRLQGTSPRKIRTVGVIGSGTMGRGITELLLVQGVQVFLLDLDMKSLRKGLIAIRQSLVRTFRPRGKDPKAIDEWMARQIKPTVSPAALGDADMVIEAVPEDSGIKQNIFQQLERFCRDDAIFATCTASLAIHQIAGGLQNPDRLVGLHFFYPPDRIQLLEIRIPRQNNRDILATCGELARRLRKFPFLVQDRPGGYVPRLLLTLLSEACFMVSGGANPFRLEKAVTAFGFPVGLFRLSDMIGMDVIVAAATYLSSSFGEQWPLPPLYPGLAGTGCYGRKTGSGWYDYQAGDGGLNFRYLEVVKQHFEESGIPPKQMAPDAVVEQLLLRAVNEAVRALEEGLADRILDMDMAMIYGAGFPPYRGGLFRYADALGIFDVYEKLLRLEADNGPRFKPAPLLREMARSGRTFYEE